MSDERRLSDEERAAIACALLEATERWNKKGYYRCGVSSESVVSACSRTRGHDGPHVILEVDHHGLFHFAWNIHKTYGAVWW